jgi:phosphate/sulfate permease
MGIIHRFLVCISAIEQKTVDRWLITLVVAAIISESIFLLIKQ